MLGFNFYYFRYFRNSFFQELLHPQTEGVDPASVEPAAGEEEIDLA